ncbi:hypothetical protein M5D96_002737 [Drosophila gunungcola]|uniref:Uncharacterized protein n=1 Tax=Drosophila gunungcola TaxID=103775 RepID=A0A9P9Z0H7_9MUSC|nr:hypothetical protein M5D96_002737 [Drosophila gunungcola]
MDMDRQLSVKFFTNIIMVSSNAIAVTFVNWIVTKTLSAEGYGVRATQTTGRKTYLSVDFSANPLFIYSY